MTPREQAILDRAAKILERECKHLDTALMLNNCQAVKQLVVTKLATADREHFCLISLDSQLRYIAFDVIFTGTVNRSEIYPREVVRQALARNAAHVILVHNHPAASYGASDGDITVTQRLKEALGLVDITVIDHIIVAGTDTYSFAEHKQL